ncbi:cell wall / vacuolar inhibitor of fructosidase 2-like [Henckelia pumila]|uniref:cell wall / vacuolar inhibitor of fructosidase 2-like n=1 Tax=Henckelia pumila TaxID=405737 RepID=UPI003C6E7C05
MAKQVVLFEIVLVQLVVVLLFSQLGINANSTKDMALIESVCQKTHDYQLCVSTLKSNPLSFKSDVKGLASIMLGIIQRKMYGIVPTIDQMGANSSDPPIRDCLKQVCSLEYRANIALIGDAMQVWKSGGKLVDALVYVQRALQNAEICENCFMKQFQRKSPITPINSNFVDLCYVAQGIMLIP